MTQDSASGRGSGKKKLQLNLKFWQWCAQWPALKKTPREGAEEVADASAWVKVVGSTDRQPLRFFSRSTATRRSASTGRCRRQCPTRASAVRRRGASPWPLPAPLRVVVRHGPSRRGRKTATLPGQARATRIGRPLKLASMLSALSSGPSGGELVESHSMACRPSPAQRDPKNNVRAVAGPARPQEQRPRAL